MAHQFNINEELVDYERVEFFPTYVQIFMDDGSSQQMGYSDFRYYYCFDEEDDDGFMDEEEWGMYDYEDDGENDWEDDLDLSMKPRTCDPR